MSGNTVSLSPSPDQPQQGTLCPPIGPEDRAYTLFTVQSCHHPRNPTGVGSKVHLFTDKVPTESLLLQALGFQQGTRQQGLLSQNQHFTGGEPDENNSIHEQGNSNGRKY